MATDTVLARTSAAPALAQLVVAGLLGLIVLPGLLDSGPSTSTIAAGAIRPQEALWLAAALLVAIWLLSIATALVRTVAGLLAFLAVRQAAPPGRAAGNGAAMTLARWIVAAGYVVVVQAVLRRPLVAMLSALLEPSAVETTFAAFVLTLLLLVLYWLHRAARPLIEATAWSALDALVATSGSEAAGRSLFPEGEAAATAPKPIGAAAAPRTVGAATIRAPAAAGDATLLAATVPTPTGDATLADDSTVPADRAAPPPAPTAG